MERKLKKGLWSPDEDQRLRDHVLRHGHGCWSSVPIHAGLQRNGKSCRLRWINYLRPGLKRGEFSLAEVDKVVTLHQILGNKWSQIAHHLPGRTDNEIKNYWHSSLKKRLVSKMAESTTHDHVGMGSSSSSSTSLGSHDHQIIKADSLPRVLFAEWLSLDDAQDFKNIHTSNINLGYCNSFESKGANGIINYVDDEIHHDMLPSPFNMDCAFIPSSFPAREFSSTYI